MTAVSKVAIAGCGVAALAASIQLAKGGAEVRVFESKPNLTALGSGITLQGKDGTLESIIVTDNDRNAADARNVGTEVDPNPATADPGRRLQVSWSRAIEGNTTEGIETDLVWTPISNYSMVFAASHLFVNKITVARPVTADPTTQRTV